MDATRGDPPSRPELSGDREDLPRGRRPVIQVALAARGDVFGAEAAHAGITPVILGEGGRRGPARTPFRVQSTRGLLWTRAC